MQAVISPGKIQGIINAPASKSLTQRAYAGALAHNGRTIIHNYGNSDDECAALSIIQSLGAEIVGITEYSIEIVSSGLAAKNNEINCCESGLATRLFVPIAALTGRELSVIGSGSLLGRPMKNLKGVLNSLGVKLEGDGDFLPFKMSGRLVPANLELDGSDSSQLLSGLLFAFSTEIEKVVKISVKNLKSKPYIDLTLAVLAKFGKVIENCNYEEFIIDPAKFIHSKSVTIDIEGDWSGAAFFLVAAAISGEITVMNLKSDSKQADIAILDALAKAGAAIEYLENGITVGRKTLLGFDFDATDCPDLFPSLAILAGCCEGESNITGVSRLFYKESNRAESITEMLDNFGIPYGVFEDELTIRGVRAFRCNKIDSFNDHRIAMAAAIGAIRAVSPIEIFKAESVKKSYPNFYHDLSLCGIDVRLD